MSQSFNNAFVGRWNAYLCESKFVQGLYYFTRTRQISLDIQPDGAGVAHMTHDDGSTVSYSLTWEDGEAKSYNADGVPTWTVLVDDKCKLKFTWMLTPNIYNVGTYGTSVDILEADYTYQFKRVES